MLPPVKPFLTSNQSSLPSHTALVMEKASLFQLVWCCSRQILGSTNHVAPKRRAAWTDGMATAQGIKDNKVLPQYLPPESSGTAVMALKGGRALGHTGHLPDLTPLQKWHCISKSCRASPGGWCYPLHSQKMKYISGSCQKLRNTQ